MIEVVVEPSHFDSFHSPTSFSFLSSIQFDVLLSDESICRYLAIILRYIQFRRSIDTEAVDVGILLVVQGLGNALIHEAGLLRDVKNKVGSLKFQLHKSLAILKGAYRSQIEGEIVRHWTLEIRDVAHEAEDVVEMFLVKAANERRRRGLFKCFSTKHDRSTGEEIDAIRVRLADFDKKYSIQITCCRQDSDEKLPDRNSDKVVGMEYEVEKLLGESVLNEQKKGLSIAVVEGMAGIGKTTLAHQIYNHPDVVNRFPYRAWAMVSSKFTLEGTMKQLILQLPGSDEQKLRELEESKKDVKNELQEILYKLLQGQTYFIVLDDVWEMKHWESLESAFPNEQDKTSRLLVTTRSKYIAKHERYTHYEMKVLDPEKSWELFLMKALISDGGCPEELEPIGREIVRRCEGLPLKISKVGGLLVQTRSKRGWQQVLNQESSLKLRYQNLSPKLRQCFLHLALFKEYATIPAKTLLHIWDLIEVQAELKADPEESARQCLDGLISQNMLQIVDWTMGGRARNVYLDGILREVCLRRANEELGLETVNTPHAVNVYGANIGTLSLHQNKNFHSLFQHNDEGVDVDVSSLSPAFSKGLEILHLDGIKLSTFPDSVRDLTKLKYLMIRRHPDCALDEVEDQLEAVKLPNWLGGLKHLEILDMEGEKVEFRNDVTLEMKRLRYFSAYCVRGPISIDSWKNIKTLKYIRQEDWIKCYSRLSSSCHVYKLGLVLDPLSKPDEWRKVRASLESLRRLQHLQLRWNRFIPFDLQIIPKLHTLTKLKLRGKLTKCPDMTIFPPNLSHLTLALSDLIEDLMPQLRELPKLSHLKLLGNAERIEVLSFSSPRLRVLIVKEMFHLKSINILGDEMPCLEQLRIQQCPSLRTMNLPAYIVVKLIT